MVQRLAGEPGMVSTKILPILGITPSRCNVARNVYNELSSSSPDHHDTCLSSKLPPGPCGMDGAVCRARWRAQALHPGELGHGACLAAAPCAPPPSPRPLSSYDSGSVSASGDGTCGTSLHATSVTNVHCHKHKC